MTNEIRELDINELDGVSGGDPKTLKIGPLRITVGEGKLGIAISGVAGFLLNATTGTAVASLGKSTT